VNTPSVCIPVAPPDMHLSGLACLKPRILSPVLGVFTTALIPIWTPVILESCIVG